MSDDWKCLVLLCNTKPKSKSINYEEATGHSNEIDNGDTNKNHTPARTCWIPLLLGINTITRHDGAANTGAKGFPRTSCTSSDRNPRCLFRVTNTVLVSFHQWSLV